MSPEISLLTALSRVELTDDLRGKIKIILNNGLDWNAFVDAARFHCLILLIFPHFKNEYRKCMPEEIFLALEAEYNQLVAWNMFLLSEFIRIHKLLRQANIPVFAYKGLISGELLYGDFCRRQFYDIDFLIAEKDFEAAYNLFSEQNFYPYQDHIALSDDYVRSKLFRKLSFELALWDKNRQVCVDLHWGLRQKHILPYSAKEVQLYAQTVVLYGHDIKTLSPEMMLVSHCVSSPMEVWRRLSWVVEVKQILETYENLDWKIVEALTAPYGLMPMVLFGVFLAHKVLEAPLSPDILRKTDTKTFHRLADITVEFFQETDWDVPKDGKTWLYALWLRQGLKHKIRYVFSYFVEPDQYSWLRMPLPEWLFFLYYPLQIFWRLQGLMGRSWQRLQSRRLSP